MDVFRICRQIDTRSYSALEVYVGKKQIDTLGSLEDGDRATRRAGREHLMSVLF